jgi:hypothetical protein
MKAPLSIAAVAALLVTTFLVMGAAGPHPEDDSISALKARISSLEQRVDNLEKKLQTRPVRTSSAIRRPSRPPRKWSPPKRWRRKEFNGIPYYLVPLNQNQSRSRQRSSRKTCR